MNVPAGFAAVQPLLDYWADHYGLARDIVYGLVWQESGFNPGAIGDNGAAFGLTQVHFDTAQGVGYKGAAAGLLDPSTNLQTGLAYLASKLAQYGNYDQALSAYNAGHAITGNASYVAGVNQFASYFASDDSDAGDVGSGDSSTPISTPIALAAGGVLVGLFILTATRSR